MSEVPIHRTPIDAQDAEAFLRETWPDIAEGVLRLLLALWDLETGGGTRMFNNNWGNLVSTLPSQDFYRASDSGNIRRFVSYATPRAGSDAFVRNLIRDSRSHWRAGLLTGNPAIFAHQLRISPAYYEAPESVYTRTLVARWNLYAHLDPDDIPRHPSAPKPSAPRGTQPHGGIVGALLVTTALGTLFQLWASRRGRRALR